MKDKYVFGYFCDKSSKLECVNGALFSVFPMPVSKRRLSEERDSHRCL